jgi:hypothetical protein
LGTFATTTPAGRVSMSAAVSVATVALGLLKVIVSVETPPTTLISTGLKAFVSVGGIKGTETTTNVAIAGLAFAPLLVIKAPGGSVLR